MGSSGIGNKFVSVNLNKSYGQQGGSGMGHPGGGRSRPGGGHGGMLVLSRPRTTQGAAGPKGSKLAVPPPLNLPSLRREHGGTDSVAQTGVVTTSTAPVGWIKPVMPANASDGEQVADGLAGKSAAPSSGSTWGTSPASAAKPAVPPGNAIGSSADSVVRPGVYTPPAARAKSSGPGTVSTQAPALPVMLRGEDFPSLQASVPHVTIPQQKQRDAQQKQRRNQEDLKEQKIKLQQLSQQGVQDGILAQQQQEGPQEVPENQASPPPMRPQMRSKQHSSSEENLHYRGNDRSRGLPGHHLQKPEGYSSGPPPLVRLDHTSNWADDERDTGRSERDFAKNDFHNNDDMGYGLGSFQKNGSFLGPGPVREGRDATAFSHYDKGTFSHYDKGTFRADSNGREVWQGGNDRDMSFRRSSSFRKEGSFSNDMGFDRERGFSRSATFSRENTIDRNHDVEMKLMRGPYGRINGQSWELDNARENLIVRDSIGKDNGSWDSGFRDNFSRDGGYSQDRQVGNHGRDGFLRKGGEQNFAAGRYGDTFGRNRSFQNDAPQNNSWNRVSFSTGSRGMPVNDPILNFGRDKRSFTSYGKPYSEDPFMKDFGNITGFDLRDPFVGGFGTEIKVSRKRKDDSKQTDFYDPIRASFEAELERVQKMQEQERQRMIEEQERAQELARKEEEERQRQAREEEERQRRLEEEAREAAWREEQQALEAARRLEEERRAREEEKRRIITEEERRKEAAKRKLLELEERIAKRQAESKKEDVPTTDDGRLPIVRSVKDRDIRRVDTGEWEDEERKIDRITSSASSESSNMSRSFDTGLRAQVLRDANSLASDRIKPSNSWRREPTENGNGSHFVSQIISVDQNNSYQSSNWESLNGGRGLPRRNLFEGSRTCSAKGLPKTERSEMMLVNDHMPFRNDQRRSNTDSEVYENTTDGYADITWEQEKSDSWRGRDRIRISAAVSYTHSSEADAFTVGRSRHFRQPRVLPPPSVTALQKGLFKNGAEKPLSSPLLEEETQRGFSSYDIESNVELSLEQDGAVNNEPLEVQVSQDEHGSGDQQGLKNMIRSDSQSLPSVSSLPGSPAHVSHDTLEETGIPMYRQNEEETPALSNLDDTLGNVISAEILKTDKCNEYVSSPSKSVGQEIHEWVFKDEDDFSVEEEYEEEHLDEEENGIFEEEEENQEKTYDYDNLHVEQQKTELKNNHFLFNDIVEMEEPVLNSLEGRSVQDGNADAIELEGKPDRSEHQESSLKAQNSVVVAEDNKHEMQEFKAPGGQLEGSADGKEGSDKVQPPLVQQPSIQQAIMEGKSGLASSESLQVQSDIESSLQCLVQPTQKSFSTPVPFAQSNISSTTTSLSSSILNPISALPSQTELPFKLQFGFFPGTSIIPATVPAIQIGSIQMPLHLHPPVSPSLTQIPPPQPPMFQFGQLSYPAPISQGRLTLSQPPMSYVHRSVSAHYSLGQPVTPLSAQHILDSTIQIQADSITTGLRSPLANQRAPAEEKPSQENRCNMDNDCFVSNKTFKSVSTVKSHAGQYHSTSAMAVDNQHIKSSKYASEIEIPVVNKIYKPFANVPEQAQNEGSSVQSSSGGLQTGGRGRGNRTMYGGRANGVRASTNTAEGLWSAPDARRPHKQGRRNIQRNEFRVTVDRRHPEVTDSNDLARKEDKPRSSVRSDSVSGSMDRGAKKDLGISAEKMMKSEIGSKTGYGTSFPSVHYEDKAERMPGGKLPQRSGLQMPVVTGSRSTEGILKRNEKSEVADDVPLQSGIVQIFKQPGIETPSDEDDFIEVKTRRQIREQRDKEMKAKSKDLKPKDQAARRYRAPPKSTSQVDGILAISHRGATSSGGEKRNSMMPSAVMVDSAQTDGRNLPTAGSSTAGSSTALLASAGPPQQLAPIGTPAGNTEGSNDKRSISLKPIQTNSMPSISHVDMDVGKGLRFENQSPGQEGISSTGVGAWGSARNSQQVVSLTQIQLEEAMKPASFEAKRAPLLPLGDHGGMALESGMSVISVLAQDKPLSSTVPLNSLLAGEKIQFGAVTSPTLLPHSSCSIMPPLSTGLGPSLACRPDGSMESSFSATEGDSTNFFNKADDRCRQMVDPEAEAEAAASAVAVAAISSDDSVGNGVGGVSMSVAESKVFGNSDVGAASVGVSITRPVMIQSRGEDSMTVALPADLSVETPSPLSLWPSVVNRQNSAGPVLSHFPGAPPPFPCFEMSPMMGGQIFAYGQHEEATPLSQGQKANTSVEQGISGMGSGPVGGWQQCHSGVDSFYGAPPSGFTGPFISPTVGIPGPPPMFVYNHFPAVGQFGQVGFMSAYIPSGKQPDWKHTPASTSGIGLSEGDISSLGIMSGQRNPNMPTSVQHMPIVPSLGLFDMNLSSPFQSAADLTMQTQWSHVPGPPTFQTMPMSGAMVGLSLPLQQTDGLSSQLSHASHTMESVGRFHHVLASKPTGSGPFSTVDAAAQFPDELGLGDSVSSNNSSVLTSRNLSSSHANYNSVPSANVKVPKGKSSSRSARSSSTGSSSESSALAVGTNNVTSSSQSLHGSRTVGHPFQSQGGSPQVTSGQYPHPVGYSEQRGTSQQHTGHKTSVANDWSVQGHRKMGSQGRSQMPGDKNFPTLKVKRVYVPKSPSSANNVGTPVTLL
ncbi:hypothetical protein SUGI_1017410 [Cryptomeria japonica]|uniref:uncharacterized protein LOC131063856 n=1 Tax=Cryptomeria japonica TaxID=3369 RepID=UPI00241473FE|nr:uncharacterized protein LOC131063856 [Cryptomeria japonica]XP_057853795.2 uncharacterized protein LOC131063856 [Cryptomeria japonica]GLJ48184.1 hypothetical protein SUGI_1017410 [Cryptomeria japonica]